MSLRWITWWVCILMFMAGCVSAVPPAPYFFTHHTPLDDNELIIPVYIEKEFGEADRAEMQKAIDQWNFALNGHIKIIIADVPFDMSTSIIQEVQRNGGWMFIKINSDNPMIKDPTDTTPGQTKYRTIAFCDKVGGDKTWFIRDRIINPEDMFGITLHEIGHLMGAHHNGKLLMSPHYTVVDYRCIDKDTMIQVSNHIGVPIGNLNYCLLDE